MSGIMLRACCRSLRAIHKDNFLPLTSQVNTLFTTSYIGIDQFLDTRHRVAGQFGPLKTKFFQRMRENIDPNASETHAQDHMIFTEDLKNTTFLIENKPEDLDLLSSMIKKFNAQNKDLRFGSFIFGPVVMRLLHSFRQPDVALSLVKDPACEGFFNQLTSYVILFDLLYETSKHEAVIELFQDLLVRGVFDNSYPRDIVCLVFASAYQLNTPEVYQKVKQIAADARKANAFISSRSVCLVAAMAVKHNDPDTAFEMLSLLRAMTYLARNVKVLTLCHLKRPDDALMLIRSYLSRDRGAGNFTGEFAADVVDVLTQAVAESNQQELVTETEQVVRALREGGHISSRSLDQMLREPIDITRPNPANPQQSRLQEAGAVGRSDERFERYNNRFSGRPNEQGSDRFDNRSNFNRDRPRRSFDDRQQQRAYEPRRGIREME